jgi:hypothetical protein
MTLSGPPETPFTALIATLCYVLAMIALAVLAIIGLAAAIRLPASRRPDRAAGGLAATPAPGTTTERG